MAAAVEQDIESFIRDQKSKLASERKAFQGGDDSRSAGDAVRRQWDRNAGRDAQLAVEVSNRPRTQEQGLPLTNRDAAQKRAVLGTERRQEYNEYMKQGRQPIGGDEGGVGGQRHDYKHTSKQLAQQRRQEYNDMLAAKEREPKAKIDENEITNPTIIPFDRVEEDRIKKRLLEEERHREYQKVKAKLDEAHSRGRRHIDDSEHLGLDVGHYQKNKQKGKEQREYREILERQVADKKMFQQYGGAPARQPERDRGYNESRSVPAAGVKMTGDDVPRLKLAANADPDPLQSWRKDKGRKDTMKSILQQEKSNDDIKAFMSKLHGKDSRHSRINRRDDDSHRDRFKASSRYDRSPQLTNQDDERDLKLAARDQKRMEEVEYHNIWRKVHANDPLPAQDSQHSHVDRRDDDFRRNRFKAPSLYDRSPRLTNQDDERDFKLTARDQKHMEDVEYHDIWRKVHANDPLPAQDSRHLHIDRRDDDFHRDRFKAPIRYDRSPQLANQDDERDLKLAARDQKRMEDVEYHNIWRKVHANDPLPAQKHVDHREQDERRQWKETAREGTKAIPDVDDRAEAARRKLAEDRKREYAELKEKSTGRGKESKRDWDVPETAAAEQPLQLGQYESKHQELQKQRQEEYNKLLQSQKKGNRSWREPSAEKLLPLGENESRKKELEAERNQEYNAYLKAQRVANRTWQEAPGESLPLGDYESKRRAVEEERKQEYQEYLRKHDTGGRRNLVHQTDEYKASFPGMNESDNTKLAKARERNDEYNKFLREKDEGKRVRYPDDQANKVDTYATLPLRDSHSAKLRQEQLRNREYNQFLASKMLPAKDDGRPPVAPRRGWATPTYEDMLEKKRQQEAQYRRRNDGGGYDYNPLEPPRRAARDDSSNYFATLPLGQSSASATQRKKDQYREDLERQMREAADGKRRERQRDRFGDKDSGEKQMDLKVNYSGLLDPEADRKARTRPRQPQVEAYQEKLVGSLERLDQISPRSEVILGRRRLNDIGVAPLELSRAPTGGVGILDPGFGNLLEAPRVSSLAAPAGLMYTPASYVTGAGTLGQSSVDDAYNFYATRNPLEDVAGPGDGGGRGPNTITGRPGASNQEMGSFAGGGGGGGGGGGRRSRVTFREEGGRNAGLGDFPTDDDNKFEAKRKAKSYQEELQRQIEEKKYKQLKAKEEQERYDLRLEREAQEYNPYGRGGGGAPMRDNHGQIVADLRSMRKDNDNLDSPRKYQPYVSPRAPAGGVEIRDDLFGPPPVQTTATGDESYARGGHGIFGMPKTDKEKNDAERYKDDLRRQIEERKMEQLRKKEAERLEDEREQKKLDDQQQRMKAEFEAEQQKIKEKEDEARRKNEELIRQAEERKRDAEERRRAAEEARAVEERREKEAEINARLATENRGKSPVIPALRNQDESGEARGNSPPVPAARTRTLPSDEQPSTSEQANQPPRAGSADVLNQLAAMRSQLQNERKRVETMLQNEKNEPDVFDPRLVQRPAPAPVVKPELDIFETARTGNAVQVRRTPADRGNPQAMDEFAQLKKGQSESRKEFQKIFPEQPSSGDTLEAQQAALLQYQEDRLQNLRDRREFESGYPKSNTPARSLQTRTPQQLHSDSAFVDVESVNNFPDDFDDIPPTSQYRNESARSRRRNKGDSSPRNRRNYRRDSSPSSRRNYGRDSSPRGPYRRDSTPRDDPFGSTTSLNVDRLAKKNQDRLKRLRELQGDEVSLYDADDVLDRFMSKQAHNRPPSGQTLQDDTWMFAGSKASGY